MGSEQLPIFESSVTVWWWLYSDLYCHQEWWFSSGYITACTVVSMYRESVVSIATWYALDGPGIGSLWGWNFPHRYWAPPSLLYIGYRVIPRGKSAGVWRKPPTPSSAEVKEKVKPNFHSPSVSPWEVIRVIFTFLTYHQQWWFLIRIMRRNVSVSVNVIKQMDLYWTHCVYLIFSLRKVSIETFLYKFHQGMVLEVTERLLHGYTMHQ